jgi:hypothetical protein
MLVSICVQLQHLLALLMVTINNALHSVCAGSVDYLTLSMNEAVLQHVGIPADLYNSPSS